MSAIEPVRFLEGTRTRGSVVTTLWDEVGRVVEQVEHKNTQTNFALAAMASSWVGQPTASSTGSGQSLPVQIALGTGTGTVNVNDLYGFAEMYGTRKPYTYRDVLFAFTGQVVVQYQTSDPVGNFTEAMLWDAPAGSASVGTGGVAAGATVLPLGSGAPAVQGGTTPGQYATIYINDGANSEYASIAATASAGAASWTLQSGLKYAHAAGVGIVVFVGNLWAHVVFAQSVNKQPGFALTVQWQNLFQGS